MLGLLYEEATQLLLDLAPVVKGRVAGDAEFIPQAVAWIQRAEALLARHRSPAVSVASMQLLTLTGVVRGGGTPGMGAVTRRRAALQSAAEAQGAVEAVVRESAQDAAAALAEVRVKMAQLLAVSSATNPIPLPPSEPRAAWLMEVWRNLSNGPETRNMHAYLAVTLSIDDRLYLLDQLLRNLLADRLESPPAA